MQRLIEHDQLDDIELPEAFRLSIHQEDVTGTEDFTIEKGNDGTEKYNDAVSEHASAKPSGNGSS